VTGGVHPPRSRPDGRGRPRRCLRERAARRCGPDPRRVAVAELAGGASRAVFTRRVGDAVAAAVGVRSATAAARLLFKASDTVGVKVNCLGGPRMSPRPEVVEGLVDVIAMAGVERSRIIVFERSGRELESAGFDLRGQGGSFVCRGIDNEWDRQPTVSGEIGSCFARLVSTTCTALVSVGVVKDHDFAGVAAGREELVRSDPQPEPSTTTTTATPTVADAFATSSSPESTG